MSDLISRSKEEWKAIQGYEGIYEVSNFGNVRSLPRYKRGNFDSKVFIEGKTIKQVKNNRGYYIVQLSKNNKVKNFSVHRLVAEAFIPNPNNFPQVNHKDEDKSNNRVSNLEWMTLKRNINYGTRNKRMALTKGKNVKAFDDDGNFIMWFCSMTVAEKITGINQGDISRCTLGKTKHAGGYVWEIVKQEAEQYNNGWIPCSSGVMPRANGWYLVTNYLGVVQEQRWYANHWEKLRDEAVLAWRELPLPYQPNGE